MSTGKEEGFYVKINFIETLTEEQSDSVMDDFIEVVEGYNLVFGGGYDFDCINGGITSRAGFFLKEDKIKQKLIDLSKQEPLINTIEFASFSDFR